MMRNEQLLKRREKSNCFHLLHDSMVMLEPFQPCIPLGWQACSSMAGLTAHLGGATRASRIRKECSLIIRKLSKALYLMLLFFYLPPNSREQCLTDIRITN